MLLFQNNRLETIVFMKTLTFIQMICFWFVPAHSPMFSAGPLCGIYTCFWQQFLFFWCFLPHPDLKSMFLNFLQNMSNLIKKETCLSPPLATHNGICFIKSSRFWPIKPKHKNHRCYYLHVRHPYHGSSPKHSKIFLCEVPMFPLALINQMSTFCHEPGETI